MTLTRRVTAALASAQGLFLTALLAGSLCCVGFLGTAGAGSHTVTARFTDADGLVAGNEVRIAGVVAGAVTSVAMGVDASGAQFAEVTMDIDADHWPLHQGTAVAVTPKGVLSNVFVEVQPGSVHSPPLGDHPFFDVKQTRSPVNLDEFGNVFTPNVRDAIRTQLQEGVIAFGGAGATNLNQTLANANPLTLDAIPVTDVLATRSPQLDNLNYEFDTITAELAREDAAMRPLIANVDTTLNALAVRETALQGTLVHAAHVFGDLSQGLSSPTTQADLARIFQQSPQTLTCATAISTYITPLISAVNPYISYNAPLSLDQLLADFVTATGFNSAMNLGQIQQPSSGDALRVQQEAAPNVPPLVYTSSDSGGLTLEHGGYRNASTKGGVNTVYAEQPPLPGHPTLNGCAPPAGLP